MFFFFYVHGYVVKHPTECESLNTNPYLNVKGEIIVLI